VTLRRDRKAVTRDVSVFESFGLVTGREEINPATAAGESSSPAPPNTTSSQRYDIPMRLAAILLLAAIPATAQDSPYQRLDFLIGKWIGVAGEKDTPLGAGQGAFSFLPELNKKIVVRRNNATYDSGATHDDLMIIYLDGPADKPRAIFFDTEGHTIRYNLTFPKPDTAVFESDGTQPGPKYRLTYWMENGGLNGKFEVAPPGAGYKSYLNWRSKKS
jgi:hypothetical protein